jgi:single-stranded DNA-binding protein
MRGINKVFVTGNASGKISYHATSSGVPACSFSIACDRRSQEGPPVTAWVRVNAYGRGLVNVCRSLFAKGVYVIVEGELMNREGQLGDITEVRAREVVFVAPVPDL